MTKVAKHAALGDRLPRVVEARDLTKHFRVRGQLSQRKLVVHAVDRINLSVDKAQTLGLVGESGSGKTTVGRCILRLIEPTHGRIFLEGKEITGISGYELRPLRRRMQMVFQDPADSLNPRFALRRTLMGAYRHAGIRDKREALERGVKLILDVGLETEDLEKYPHQFSGGQQQRIAIARALAFDPVLLILDEPTASLDVSVKTQITDLLTMLQDTLGHSYILISHDLSSVRGLADHVAVMYMGKVVEYGPKHTIFRNPAHPYTRVLINSVPIPDPFVVRERITLEGEIPSPIHPPSGCRFHTRCPQKERICSEQEPHLLEASSEHTVACHIYGRS